MKHAILLVATLAIAAAQINLVAIAGNNLLFNLPSSGNPISVTSQGTVTGLSAAGETLLSIAQFPSTTQTLIYALSTLNKIYLINPTAFTASLVSTLTCAPAGNSNPTVGIDFNPNTGGLSILSLISDNTQTNFWTANVSTGACTPLQRVALSNGSATFQPAGIAFRFEQASTAPTLFVLDAGTNGLYTVNPYTGGVLTQVGNLPAVPLSGVGGFSVLYNTNPQGISVLYNITSRESSIYAVNLATGALTRTGPLNITINLLGVTARDNTFPSGVLGGNSGNTGTTGSPTGTGNNGVITFSGPSFTATATVPVPLTTTSFTTSAAVSGTDGSSNTREITVLAPAGSGSYTKTIAVTNAPGSSNLQVATVTAGAVNGTVTEAPIQRFTDTVVANFGGPTITLTAAVLIPAGQVTATATVATNEGTSTVSRLATILLGGVDRVTVPVIPVSGLQDANQTVVVTVGDTAGQTSTQIATVQLDRNRLANFLGSASSTGVSIALLVVLVIAALL